jgi:hypothetical protein
MPNPSINLDADTAEATIYVCDLGGNWAERSRSLIRCGARARSASSRNDLQQWLSFRDSAAYYTALMSYRCAIAGPHRDRRPFDEAGAAGRDRRTSASVERDAYLAAAGNQVGFHRIDLSTAACRNQDLQKVKIRAARPAGLELPHLLRW